jgi:hypothetical protein
MPTSPIRIPPPAPQPDSLVRQLWRRIGTWLADVATENPHVVPHDGGCGRRFFCDLPEHRVDGYRRVELRDNGDLLFHCEKLTLHRGDLSYAGRRAGLEA